MHLGIHYTVIFKTSYTFIDSIKCGLLIQNLI